MKSFVIVYDRPTGHVDLEEFAAGQRAEAFARRSVLERTVSPTSEVVVLHAHDVADLKTTHRRYFDTVREIVSAAGV